MNKLLILLLVVSFSAFGQRTKVDIPEEVEQAFVEKYGSIQVSKWRYRKYEDHYVAEFKYSKDKHRAYYKPDGEWFRTEKLLRRSKLPKDVWFSFQRTDYFRWEVYEFLECYTPTDFFYVLVLQEPGYQNIYLQFLPDGTEVRDKYK
ncbi:hypothetical protein RCC89_09545 [Cytophagaceae bacterium ABcell3]|nr:hypothetical protein RCC89_09545 [Cytophagaceae bacterium ABcell3]